MLKDLVNDKQIQLQVPVDGWKDAIIKAAQPLIDEDFIKQSYVQAMIDSVTKYGPYIVIGPSIALAHARPEDGANKLGVSIMTLKDLSTLAILRTIQLRLCSALQPSTTTHI